MNHLNRTILTLASFGLCIITFFSTQSVFASNILGTIDPNNEGFYKARLLNDPGFGADTLEINVGKFSTVPNYNVTISDAGMRGYMWGETLGWVVLSCVDTTSGCTAINGNFRVTVSSSGVLGGYAWGENAGWINFGPFTNTATSRIKIGSDGRFGGTDGTAGYAWTQNFGWIVFDCSVTSTCVVTDFIPSGVRPDEGNVPGYLPITEDPLSPSTTSAPQTTKPVTPNQSPGAIPAQNPISTTPTSSTGGETQNPPLTPTPSSTAPVSNGSTNNGSIPQSPQTPQSASEILRPIFTRTISKDIFVEYLRQAIQAVQEIFTKIINGIVSVMETKKDSDIIRSVAVLGLIIMTVVAATLALGVPIAGMAGMSVVPYFFIEALLLSLGFIKNKPQWGMIVNSSTHTPLALAHVYLRRLEQGQKRLIAKTITHSDGSFTFTKKIPEGMYTLSVQTNGTTLPFVESPETLGPSYTGQPFSVTAHNIPQSIFAVSVVSSTKPNVTPLKEFLLYYEVGLTNLSLVMFGAGTLASVLYAIFYPGTVSFSILALYLLCMIFRGLGVMGSYGSTFIDRITDQPISGKIVSITDLQTHTEVHRTLTSEYGRAYISLPKGYYGMTLRDVVPTQVAAPIVVPLVSSKGGMLRKRFLL